MTVFAALGATVTFASLAWGATGFNCGVLEMPPSAELPPDAVLVSILLPFSAPDEHVATYKISAREQDASPIVNAGFGVQIDSTGAVARAVVVYGGLGRAALRVSAVERFLEGRQWTSDTLSAVMSVLHAALAPATIELPDELFSAEYRRSLAESLFYKFFVRTAVALHPTDVPAECASAAATDDRPISSGRVEYPDYAADFPVGQPLVKFSAFLQATGEALFTHDLPCPPRTAHAAVVKSARPAARFQWRYRSAIGASAIAAAAVAECPGLLGVITSRTCRPAAGILSGSAATTRCSPTEMNCVGAVVALAVANTIATARAAARFIERQRLEREDLSPVSAANSLSQG